jgi:hypothetical protein
VRYAERSRLRTAPRVAGVIMGVLLASVVVGYVLLWFVVNQSIRATSVDGLARTEEGVTNVLVATAPGDGGVLDGVAVVQVAEGRARPAVLVLPVALELDVPDTGGVTLADAPTVGGMALLVEEVARYTGMDLHHYVRIDRAALAELVDASGGLDECPGPDVDPCPRLIGDDVRARLAAPEGSVTNAARVVAHADVVRVVATELDRLRTALDPRRAMRWARGWDAVLTTDLDPGAGDVRDLAALLETVDPDDVDVRILPGLVDGGRITVQPETAAVLLAAFTQVAPLPVDVGLEAPRELVPADVTVRVLNGVGRAGVAGDVADFLTERGFVVSDVDNALRFDRRAPTRITHRPQDEPLGALVGALLPDAELVVSEDVPPGVDVVVTVGAGGAP